MQGRPPLSEIVTVDDQVATLGKVLRRVADLAAKKRRPVVEIDLDLTALRPVERTRLALADVGLKFEVAELAYPQPGLSLLPGYTDEAWSDFLDRSGLQVRHPKVPWKGEAYATFHADYWTTDRLIEDEPTPGLGEFVRRVEDHGGTVVFLSGRWRVDQVPPSLAALKRAGIAEPILLIGNPLHEKNILPGEVAWSDSKLKSARQVEIRERQGTPVAIFDDRKSNRDAIVEANAGALEAAGLPGVLSIGVAIPGFSFDPQTARAELRVSSFESFFTSGPDPRREPYLAARYPARSTGSADLGQIAGLGRNARGYVLPRQVASPQPPSGFKPLFASLAQQPVGSMTAEAFMVEVEATIPAHAINQIDETLNLARSEAEAGLASPFPSSLKDLADLRHTLACSWLHSRDIEVVMAAIGYPVATTGVHDMMECVPAAEVIEAIARSLDRGSRYSDWFLRWVQRLDRRGVVNIDFLNPNLAVSMWRWREGEDMPQDAMDAHRVSSHHEGDGAARYDPIEATVNNLLHAREGIYGVQKSPVTPWTELEAEASSQVGAEALAKSGWGGQLLLDAIPILRFLESRGYVLPWDLVADSKR